MESFPTNSRKCSTSDNSAAVSLLNAVASELHRRVQEKAQRNLENVLALNPAPEVPHAAEIISALWLRSFNTDRLVGTTYSDLPLEARQTAGDPRLSIAERYKSREDYLGQVRISALALAQRRFLRVEDIPTIVDESAKYWDFLTSPDASHKSGEK